MARIYPLDPLFARKLVARRRALGWSQNRLALAAGLTESYLQKIETLRLGIAPPARVALEAALACAEGQNHLDAPLSSGGAR